MFHVVRNGRYFQVMCGNNPVSVNDEVMYEDGEYVTDDMHVMTNWVDIYGCSDITLYKTSDAALRKASQLNRG